jgi:hypothetical protein
MEWREKEKEKDYLTGHLKSKAVSICQKVQLI